MYHLSGIRVGPARGMHIAQDAHDRSQSNIRINRNIRNTHSDRITSHIRIPCNGGEHVS